MSYTRYDYRKKRKKNIVIYFLVIIFSITISGGIFKLLTFAKVKFIKTSESGNTITSGEIQEEKTFSIIQCGLFSKEENAKKTLDKISSDFQKIVVKDEDMYKVIAGIYTIENTNEKSLILSKEKIENFKINCIFNNKDKNEKVIAAIVEGYLKIIDIVNEEDVAGYDTKKFKEWVLKVSSNGEGQELEKLLENIDSLPEEYKKENISNSINFLYNLLMKYKK